MAILSAVCRCGTAFTYERVSNARTICDGCRALPRARREGRRDRDRGVTVGRRRLAKLIRANAIYDRDPVRSVAQADRPRTRGDCLDGPRPCPFVSCRWHLYLDPTPSGGVHLNYPDGEPDELAESCALDVADSGETTLQEVGALLNVTRERVRQIELGALFKIRRRHETSAEMLEEARP